MKVILSGSRGLIGSALAARLSEDGHDIRQLVRRPVSTTADDSAIHWLPTQNSIDRSRLDKTDVVIHLAGENLAGNWTETKKQEIRDSRVLGTKTLCEALASIPHPPKVIISASAVGYYGNRGDEELTESSKPGEGFLSQVCQEWEAATAAAEQRGIRVVHVRFGVVVGPGGGAVAQMMPVFNAGFGGKVGSGKQWMGWISLADVIRAITFCVRTPALRGPVNLVAPAPITNKQFTQSLAKALGKPSFMSLPAFVAKRILGEMAVETVLASAKVLPAKLTEAKFTWRHENIDDAMKVAVGR